MKRTMAALTDRSVHLIGGCLTMEGFRLPLRAADLRRSRCVRSYVRGMKIAREGGELSGADSGLPGRMGEAMRMGFSDETAGRLPAEAVGRLP